MDILKVLYTNYLTTDSLKGFENYKYSSIDTNPLSKYVMHPTWNYIVKFIPKWVAPNVLTFAGFTCVMIISVTLVVYDYEFKAVDSRTQVNSIPNMVFIVSAVLMFLAYNLDGIDGKQARRIGVSGPLGELFDHGLDTYVTFLAPIALFSVFGSDQQFSSSGISRYCDIISVTLSSYITHCLKYNTGTIVLPWGYDLSMWVVSTILLIAGLKGPQVFKFLIYGNLSFFHGLEITTHVLGLALTVTGFFYYMFVGYKNRTLLYSLPEAPRPLYSMGTALIVLTTWAFVSPNDVIENDLRTFLILYGTCYSHINSRLIVSSMSNRQCDVIGWINWPLLAGLLLCLYEPRLEYSVLYFLVIFCTIVNFHYGVCVVQQMCAHFQIQCFTVTKKKDH